jgi:hypothetical protein
MALNLDMLIEQYSEEVHLPQNLQRKLGYDPLSRLEKAFACKVHQAALVQPKAEKKATPKKDK